jgi:acetyltransferase-like isoleucine patch superfamily enzyme
MSVPLLHAIVPGSRLADDWFRGEIPSNIEVGENCVIDSAFGFKHFYSTLPVGLRLGDNVTLWRTSLASEAEARIEIGDDCYLANASIAAVEHIRIGSRVFIAGGVTIADCDFHPMDPALRLADSIALSPVGDRNRRPRVESRPVIIEDDVWIGFNAVVLKGVRIGNGVMVQPGSLVLRDIPANTVVSGNPARPVE